MNTAIEICGSVGLFCLVLCVCVLGRGPVPVCGLLGTGPHKWQASTQSFICTYVGSRLCLRPSPSPPPAVAASPWR